MERLLILKILSNIYIILCIKIIKKIKIKHLLELRLYERKDVIFTVAR